MKKILIADDERPIRDWLRFCIEKNFNDIETDAVSNGQEALHLFQKHPYDLVITDIKMPLVNGIHLSESIRQLNSNTRIIVLTAYSDFNLVRKAFMQDIDEYILKTEIDEGKICQLIHHIFSAASSGRIISISPMDALLTADRHKEIVEALNAYGFPLPSIPGFILFSKGSKASLDRIILPQTSPFTLQIRFFIEESHLVLWYSANCVEKKETHIYKEQQLLLYLKEIAGMNSGLYFFCTGIQDGYESLLKSLRSLYEQSPISFYYEKRLLYPLESSTGEYQEITVAYREMISRIRNKIIPYIQYDLESFFLLIQKHKPLQTDYIRQLCKNICEQLYLLSSETADNHFSEFLLSMNNSLNSAADFFSLQQFTTTTVKKLTDPFALSVSRYSAPVRTAIRFIQEKYGTLHSINDVAAEVFLNPDYFSRIFKEETGINFGTFLNNYRLDKAMELLNTSDMKIYEIADTVGFSSLSYFSRKFKEHFGVNPYHYVKKERE